MEGPRLVWGDRVCGWQLSLSSRVTGCKRGMQVLVGRRDLRVEYRDSTP